MYKFLLSLLFLYNKNILKINWVIQIYLLRNLVRNELFYFIDLSYTVNEKARKLDKIIKMLLIIKNLV